MILLYRIICLKNKKTHVKMTWAAVQLVKSKIQISTNKMEIETDLVVILHQLDDDSNVVRVILDGNDSHDVGSVLGVRILAIFVGQDQAGVGFVDLQSFLAAAINKFKRSPILSSENARRICLVFCIKVDKSRSLVDGQKKVIWSRMRGECEEMQKSRNRDTGVGWGG